MGDGPKFIFLTWFQSFVWVLWFKCSIKSKCRLYSGFADSYGTQSIKSHPDGKKTPNATLSHSTHLHSPSNPTLMGKKHLTPLYPTQPTHGLRSSYPSRHLFPLLIWAVISPPFRREIDPAWNTTEGHAPLVELALHRKPRYAPNVAHHHLLLSLMEAFFLFQLKSVKILSDLFDAEDRDAFFTELHVQTKGWKSKASASATQGAK